MQATNVKFSATAYAILLQMAQPAKDAARAAEALKTKKEGAYSFMVKAGIECLSAGETAGAVFQATLDKLTSNIAFNRDSCAVNFGAKKRDKITEDGRKYKIPNAISSAGSQVAYALAHGVSLFKIDPKTKKPGSEPEAFTAIRKENDAIRSQERTAKAEALTGHDGKVYQCRKVLMATADELADLSDDTLERIISGIAAALNPPKVEQPSKPKAVRKPKAVQTVGDQIEPQKKAA